MSTGARIRAMPIRRILRISSCTAAIEPGKWSGKDLAWAYDGRGAAYIGVRPWLAPRVDRTSVLMAPIRFSESSLQPCRAPRCQLLGCRSCFEQVYRFGQSVGRVIAAEPDSPDFAIYVPAQRITHIRDWWRRAYAGQQGCQQLERPRAPIDDVMMPLDPLERPVFRNDRIVLQGSKGRSMFMTCIILPEGAVA